MAYRGGERLEFDLTLFLHPCVIDIGQVTLRLCLKVRKGGESFHFGGLA